MNRIAAFLLVVSLVFCLLCACDRQGNLAESEESHMASSQQPSNSVTYVAFDDADDTRYPVSCVQDGVQRLVGDIGPVSLLDEAFLVAPSEQLSKMETDGSGCHVESIFSNGQWDFFPDSVETKTYSVQNQPVNSEWHRYFREKLTNLGCDSPVVIRNASTFLWNGKKAAVVTAENVTIADSASLLTKEEVRLLSATPANTAPGAYRFATLFVEELSPIDLDIEFYEIPAPAEGAKAGLSYGIWTGESDYLHCMTTLQTDKSGTTVDVPVFANATGEQSLRRIASEFCWLVADIDGDSTSEVLFCVNAPSSLYGRYWVYGMEKGKVSQRLNVGMG